MCIRDRLPDSYITDYINRIENTDVKNVNKTLKETLTPDKFIIVTVGKPNIAENSDLKKLK